MASQAGAAINLMRWPPRVMFLYALDILHQLSQPLRPEFVGQAVQVPRGKLIVSEEATRVGLDIFDSKRRLVRQVRQTVRFAAKGSRPSVMSDYRWKHRFDVAVPVGLSSSTHKTASRPGTYLCLLTSRRYSQEMIITVTVYVLCLLVEPLDR
jgi:hypothetical protein